MLFGKVKHRFKAAPRKATGNDLHLRETDDGARIWTDCMKMRSPVLSGIIGIDSDNDAADTGISGIAASLTGLRLTSVARSPVGVTGMLAEAAQNIGQKLPTSSERSLRRLDTAARRLYSAALQAPPRARKAIAMKIRNSLKSAKTRDKNCRVVRRHGRVYVINKKNPRMKARQG